MPRLDVLVGKTGLVVSSYTEALNEVRRGNGEEAEVELIPVACWSPLVALLDLIAAGFCAICALMAPLGVVVAPSAEPRASYDADSLDARDDVTNGGLLL